MMSVFILPQTRLSTVCQFDGEAILFDKSDDHNNHTHRPHNGMATDATPVQRGGEALARPWRSSGSGDDRLDCALLAWWGEGMPGCDTSWPIGIPR